MDLRLVAAERSQLGVLRNLMQLYAHDFSELIGLELGDDGLFSPPSLEPYFTDPRRLPFLFRVGDRLAGFALVDRGSRLSSEDDVWDMAEFFVVRKHRRAGVGAEAARQLFARYTGTWEVRQRRENVGATAFWRKTIEAFTRGHFTDTVLDDACWCGPVQRFTSV